jgi:hypothetical protein
MHEFNVIDEGKRALKITVHQKYWEFEDDGSENIAEGGMVVGNSFQEVGATTGEVIFEWDCLSHIPLSVSHNAKPPRWGNTGPEAASWNYLLVFLSLRDCLFLLFLLPYYEIPKGKTDDEDSHMNSVDKDSAGDYLLSARYTSTIYKISHLTGSITWSLGGKDSSSSFLPDERFNFSLQHDARFRGENHDTNITLISFLNSTGDNYVATAENSTAFLVALNNTDMTATLIGQWRRPDGRLSRAKGNVQILDGLTDTKFIEQDIGIRGNIFVGWGANGYLSEFAPSGDCIQLARFLTLNIVSTESINTTLPLLRRLKRWLYRHLPVER